MNSFVRPATLLVSLSAAMVGCFNVGTMDNASQVKDLRALGLSFEPPEIMAEACDTSPQTLAIFSSPVVFSALIVDPKGQGRAIDYEILACADPGDRTCSTAEDRVVLSRGTFSGSFPPVPLSPGSAITPAGVPLLVRVLETDDYRGLGGIRMPVVLHLRAGAEEIYAQKLMVFSCHRLPQMRPNHTPQLRGMSADGIALVEGRVAQLSGAGALRFQPDDFSDLQEVYYVPDFSLQPVQLTESWRISWFTDFGTFSPTVTGGADFGGTEGRHSSDWHPDTFSERDVHFWLVVRNGRGGESWISRTVHFVP